MNHGGYQHKPLYLLDSRRLISLMKRRGLSLGELSRRCGISRQLLHYYIKMSRPYAAEPIAEVLGIDPAMILKRNPGAPKPRKENAQ